MTLPRIRKPRPPKRYPRRAWQIEDDEYLAKWYNKKPVKLIARALKRTVHSVFRRASDIGIAYTGHRLALTVNQVTAILGIVKSSLMRRLTDDALDPIPHHRVGRYIEIYQSELHAWLNKGNILAFERPKIDQDFRRMYDTWHSRVITTAEINAECEPLLGHWTRTKHDAPEAVCMMPGKIKCYLKTDVYAWAYQWGHIIPPWASPRFLVIRDAWNSEFIHKAEVMTALGVNYATKYISPHCPSGVRTTYKRSELCARLAALGMHDLARRWKSTPISWQELMFDYERTQR